MIKEFQINKKINLTHDIFEIHCKSNEILKIKPGQFITFIIPGIGGRAYSILKQDGYNNILIIKDVKKENGGRGGSELLCNAKIGDIFKWVGPAGHFILKEEDNNKLFLGTGTGLAPLYNQIIAGLERGDKGQYTLLFGSRKEEDVFYIENFKELSNKYNNFNYKIYLSREEKKEGIEKGYVTDFLIEKNIKKFTEFYICGIHNMIDSSIEKLKEFGISEENIFFEKY